MIQDSLDLAILINQVLVDLVGLVGPVNLVKVGLVVPVLSSLFS